MAEAVRAGRGGIAGLRRFLEEHAEAVAWDIPHYWPGRSLKELFRGEMSWLELRVFLRYLPADSATHRSVHPRTPEEEFWTPERHLMAYTVDALREQTFAMVKLHGDAKKTKRLRPPTRIPRPGVEAPERDARVIRFGGRHGSGAKDLAGALRGAGATQ